MKSYLITLEVYPVITGQVYDSLPLHCTLVHWFHFDGDYSQIENIIDKVAAATSPIRLSSFDKDIFTGFTKTGTIPVKVNKTVASNEIIQLHNILCDELDEINVSYAKSEYIRQGYNPHVTQHNNKCLPIGASHVSKAVCLVAAKAPEYGNDRVLLAKVALNPYQGDPSVVHTAIPM